MGKSTDAPKHFVDWGPSLVELPIERFIYERPLLVDLPRDKGSLIEPVDLAPWMPAVAAADCLIIRTGLEALRASDPAEYAANGCAFSIAAAQYLIEQAPHLKAVGFDFISLASPANAEHGVRAHQILLGMDTPHFICIIEDMMLAHVDRMRLGRVMAMPLRVRGADSGQVSILAEMRDADE